jgi:hypothetical protein
MENSTADSQVPPRILLDWFPTYIQFTQHLLLGLKEILLLLMQVINLKN